MPGLESMDGPDRLSIDVTAYEREQPVGDEWEDNWLLIAGEAQCGDYDTWTFCAPCLTTWELNELTNWLKVAATRGRVPVHPPGGDELTATPEELAEQGWLSFVEPNLAFGVSKEAGPYVTLHVRLSDESAPPASDAAALVELVVAPSQLQDFAAELERQAFIFPKR